MSTTIKGFKTANGTAYYDYDALANKPDVATKEDLNNAVFGDLNVYDHRIMLVVHVNDSIDIMAIFSCITKEANVTKDTLPALIQSGQARFLTGYRSVPDGYGGDDISMPIVHCLVSDSSYVFRYINYIDAAVVDETISCDIPYTGSSTYPNMTFTDKTFKLGSV